MEHKAESALLERKGEDQFEFAYQCHQCKKGFTNKANLYKHKMEHKNEPETHDPEPEVNKNKEPNNKHKKFQF